MLSDNFLDYNMYIPPTPTPTLSAYAPMTLRVNCGGPQFADSVPQTWLADQQYSGAVSWGWIASANNVSPYTGQTIANTTNNQQLFIKPSVGETPLTNSISPTAITRCYSSLRELRCRFP